MKYILSILSISILLFGATIKDEKWKSGETLLTFFEKNHIPKKLYFNLDGQTKELADEIVAGVRYYILKDKDGSIKQALIPITEELQIHIYQKKGKYSLELIPTIYKEREKSFVLNIEKSPYQDLIEKTGNMRLAKEFILAFKNSIDFRRSIKKGDKFAVIYKEKTRLGKIYGSPKIEAALIETNGRPHYIFNFNDRYYDEKGREVERFFLIRPIKHARITSRFTLRRYHPILHKYRAHLGVDFGARRGTPVRAAGSGRVIFAGRKGGYGNVIIIRHNSVYKTLYAHLSKFKRGMRRGKYVKQGEVIAYVGSTGLSTGPHLHFGLYKNGRAINPLRVVRITKSRLYGKRKKEFLKVAKRYKNKLQETIKSLKKPEKLSDFPLFFSLNRES